MYFIYLRRMKRGDKDAYDLHRQIGIQIMPQSALETFEKWRTDFEFQELSDWWVNNRPAFGAYFVWHNRTVPTRRENRRD